MVLRRNGACSLYVSNGTRALRANEKARWSELFPRKIDFFGEGGAKRPKIVKQMFFLRKKTGRLGEMPHPGSASDPQCAITIIAIRCPEKSKQGLA